eukprot:Skav223337  [mRNA]  locus=scaffold200:206294:214544:+ [translate_table: standard]
MVRLDMIGKSRTVSQALRLCQVVSGLRFCPPDLTPSWPRAPRCDLTELPIFQAEDAAAAASAIQQQGWAVVKAALAAPQLKLLKLKAPEAAAELLRQDPQRVGNRGPRRYSWGGSSTSHHMVHWAAWAQLLDVAPVVRTLEEVFQGEYLAVGGGGDFVLGETDSHQRLHVDLQLEAMYDSESPAAVVANFVISEISCDDGPLRLVPRTQNVPMASQLAKDWGYATHLQKEDSILVEKNLSYVFVCPLSPGDVILRDMRLWHGGSPNLGLEPRYLPSAEFLSLRYAEATRQVEDHFTPRPALPFASWLRLSPATQRRSREILTDSASLRALQLPEAGFGFKDPDESQQLPPAAQLEAMERQLQQQVAEELTPEVPGDPGLPAVKWRVWGEGPPDGVAVEPVQEPDTLLNFLRVLPCPLLRCPEAVEACLEKRGRV